MTFWNDVKKLNAEQLLGAIRKFDYEKKYPSVGYTNFERVTFQINSEEELREKVMAWGERSLYDDYDKQYHFEYSGPGAYAVTAPQGGAFEMKRRVLSASEVVEELYPHERINNSFLSPDERAELEEENKKFEEFIAKLLKKGKEDSEA